MDKRKSDSSFEKSRKTKKSTKPEVTAERERERKRSKVVVTMGLACLRTSLRKSLFSLLVFKTAKATMLKADSVPRNRTKALFLPACVGEVQVNQNETGNEPKWRRNANKTQNKIRIGCVFKKLKIKVKGELSKWDGNGQDNRDHYGCKSYGLSFLLA